MTGETPSRAAVLVVGGTGMLGRPVVERLREDGYSVRVLTRDPDRAKDALGEGGGYVEVDVDDAASLDRALEGCTAIHVSLKAGPRPGEPERVEHQGTARIAEAAARARLDRITYLSGSYAVAEHGAESEAEAAKVAAERAIEASGVPFTIFKPTYFMETLPLHVQGSYGVVLGRQPHPLHLVAADDYAAMVSEALTTPESAGRRLYVFGPEALTLSEALRIYCCVVEDGKRVVTAPLPMMKALNRVFMGGAMSRELALMAIMQRLGEPTGVPDAAKVLSPATTTLRMWCERRAAFKA